VTILVGDDRLEVREALRLALRHAGFDTVLADSPESVLQKAESEDVDLVLMDMNYTHGLDSGDEGLELLSRLGDRDSRVPVVVMTAWGTVDLAVEAMRRGARDVVLKPWDNRRLIETLRSRLLEKQSPQKLALRELESARHVQSRFLPRAIARAEGIDCAATCVQVEGIGGDSYDAFQLRDGRHAFVLTDACGKGVSAALLAAHLQAALRSRLEGTEGDLSEALAAVNRTFFEVTSPERYATLFLATWDEATRELQWVNCGHAPPILLRRDGSVEKLSATATALGLFQDWRSDVRRLTLEQDDLLAVFSDGLVETTNRDDEEFGAARVEATLRARNGGSLVDLAKLVLARVSEFRGGRPPQDDLSLLLLAGV
jgi:sigma-B regulation protein RsbU (phosphoserine phosphatase)